MLQRCSLPLSRDARLFGALQCTKSHVLSRVHATGRFSFIDLFFTSVVVDGGECCGVPGKINEGRDNDAAKKNIAASSLRPGTRLFIRKLTKRREKMGKHGYAFSSWHDQGFSSFVVRTVCLYFVVYSAESKGLFEFDIGAGLISREMLCVLRAMEYFAIRCWPSFLAISLSRSRK